MKEMTKFIGNLRINTISVNVLFFFLPYWRFLLTSAFLPFTIRMVFRNFNLGKKKKNYFRVCETIDMYFKHTMEALTKLPPPKWPMSTPCCISILIPIGGHQNLGMAHWSSQRNKRWKTNSIARTDDSSPVSNIFTYFFQDSLIQSGWTDKWHKEQLTCRMNRSALTIDSPSYQLSAHCNITKRADNSNR